MDVSDVAREVLALMQADGMALSDDLSQLEQSVRQKVPEIGAKEMHLASRRLGYEDPSRPCQTSGKHCGEIDRPQCDLVRVAEPSTGGILPAVRREGERDYR